MAFPKPALEFAAPPVERTPTGLRRWCAQRRAAGERIGLVPTMGALHDGHLRLVETLGRFVDRVVVSIFVNPTQFAPGEDFARYPRAEAADLAKLADLDVDLAYLPTVEAMYPQGFSTTITVDGSLTAGLDAVARPGHFTGVATVVGKLLLQAMPDVAAFGEKDYQQLQVIRRLTRDLDLPTEILPVPTVRDADGLALSSRNAYLSPAELVTAKQLNKILARTAAALRAGASAAAATEQAQAELIAADFTAIDYVALVDADTLSPLDRLPGTTQSGKARLLAAARIGRTRLIDNIAVPMTVGAQ